MCLVGEIGEMRKTISLKLNPRQKRKEEIGEIGFNKSYYFYINELEPIFAKYNRIFTIREVFGEEELGDDIIYYTKELGRSYSFHNPFIKGLYREFFNPSEKINNRFEILDL